MGGLEERYCLAQRLQKPLKHTVAFDLEPQLQGESSRELVTIVMMSRGKGVLCSGLAEDSQRSPSGPSGNADKWSTSGQ